MFVKLRTTGKSIPAGMFLFIILIPVLLLSGCLKENHDAEITEKLYPENQEITDINLSEEASKENLGESSDINNFEETSEQNQDEMKEEIYNFNLSNNMIFEGDFSDEEMGDYVIAFSTDIDDFSSVSIGKGADNGTVLTIDKEYVKIFNNNELKEQYDTSVGISRYLNITISNDLKNKAVIEITSEEGKQVIEDAVWSGRIGKIFAKTDENTNLKNCTLSYACAGWEKSIWLMGDSYFNCTSRARWTSYLTQNGYEGFLLNGYPGRKSEEAMASLKTMLQYGEPDEIIWCLGMNDGDSSDEINSSWQKNVEELMKICREKDIELILSTIPNCPSVNNSYKNEYVKNSGYKYIDFAEAVGASSDSEWDEGMLEEAETPIHPAKAGAKALYDEAVSTCPELIKN